MFSELAASFPARKPLAARWPAPVQRSRSELTQGLILEDGRAVDMRPVHAGDAPAMQNFVRGLSGATRQMRFHIGIRELPPDLLRAMTAVDPRCHVAVVAEAQHHATASLAAEARYVRSHARRSEAEFALTVADAWQGAGLGRALLQRLMCHARRRGVTRWVGDVVHENLPMIALVRSMGGLFVAVPGDATLLRAVFDLSKDGAALPDADHALMAAGEFTMAPSDAPALRMRTALACGSR